MKIVISESHKKELQLAKYLLENPGIAAKLTGIIGTPIEKGFENLPKNWKAKIGELTQKSLLKAADAAIFTMNENYDKEPSNKWYKLGVAASGGIGGLFGLAALAIELPISTTIMIRSIADIARSQGELITEYESKLACLEVFALGGESKSDDAAESGYFFIRAALAASVTEALATRTATEKTTPALIKFIVNITQRFGIQISEKAAAQAIPIIGAAGGALINILFIDHFQDMAKGHFTVRKLERIYGQDLIKETYDLLD
jgi:hypothetical protein